ncbi:MAG: hypothetical protein BJ554DRAFT_3734 [Olpidium bornovanus]|uniref:Uncharacterized protein n=1 Tax=Olpidium bornovanus TaxID=278681 RepID=A0A8H7ZN87_9FUNG|nr:MAG: hypothetical protein BJ554DRAFT_3734 [Olpidium bornovanus]
MARRNHCKDRISEGFDGAQTSDRQLSPVQTQRVQEGRKPLHDEQDAHDHNAAGKGFVRERQFFKQHIPEHIRELYERQGDMIAKRKCPKTEVRSGVGDTPQAKLDGVDALVHNDVAKTLNNSTRTKNRRQYRKLDSEYS